MRAREASQQLSLWPEKRMRPVEGTYGDLMGHDVAESLARKPAMEMEGWRLDLEGGAAAAHSQAGEEQSASNRGAHGE